jgi:hypothetical protein
VTVAPQIHRVDGELLCQKRRQRSLRYEHAKMRWSLPLLAYNLCGGSFFKASCRLGGKPTGRFL